VRTSAFFAGTQELIGAFRRGRDAVARTTAPNGRGNVTDTFSLSGFTAAYEAISRACPARSGR
jgi:invasion protein IalB